MLEGGAAEGEDSSRASRVCWDMALEARACEFAVTQRYTELGEAVFREESDFQAEARESDQRVGCDSICIRNCKYPWDVNG